MGHPYQYGHGPELLTYHGGKKEDILRNGVNCQLFTHIVYYDFFGVVLPHEMRSLELFTDETLFRDVQTDGPDTEPLMIGDVFFVGKRGLATPEEFKKLHLATFVGMDPANEPLLLHNSKYSEGSDTVTLPTLLQQRAYPQLYGVRRLRDDLFAQYIEPVINTNRTV